MNQTNYPVVCGKEKTVFKGQIFEVVRRPMKIGSLVKEFEWVRRSPGTRLMIIKDKKMLLTKEFRNEINGFDYRLPGGKVFDTLNEYNKALERNENIEEYALLAAKKECLEETGLTVNKIRQLQKTIAGATVEWDLYYFLVDSFTDSGKGQKQEEGEAIFPEWKTFDEVKEMCLNGKIKEDRSVGIILKFLVTTKHCLDV